MTASRCARRTAPPPSRAGSRRDTFGQSLGAVVDAWEAADDRTIRIRLKPPFPLLLDALAKPAAVVPFIMPERIARTDPFTQVTEIVGSGPYRFVRGRVRLRQPRGLCAQRRATCRGRRHRPAPPAARWRISSESSGTIIPDSATAAAALQSGEVDWWEQINADLGPVLRRSRGVTVEIANTLGYIGVARFNHLHPPFDKPAVRRALLGAINQEDYVRAVTANDADAWRDLPFHVALRHALWRGAAGQPAGRGARPRSRARGAARGRLCGREGRHHQPDRLPDHRAVRPHHRRPAEARSA